MIADVLAYARTRMEALELQEWPDALSENAPRTLHDRSYHLELGTVSRVATHQDSMTLSVPFIVRIFRQQRRDTKTRRDDAISQADSVISSFVSATNRLNSNPGVHDIRFENMSIEPLGATNDNAVVLILSFTAQVIMSLR